MFHLVTKYGFQSLKNTPFHGCDKSSELVKLKPPMVNEPAFFIVVWPPEHHKRMIIKFVKRLTNHIAAHLSLICYLIICKLVHYFENSDYLNSFFTNNATIFIRVWSSTKNNLGPTSFSTTPTSLAIWIWEPWLIKCFIDLLFFRLPSDCRFVFGRSQ